MQKYVVIDVETTGQSASKGDRIIEIALVVIENNQIVKEYSQFVNPEKSIPPFITQLTSITDEDVESQPVFADIVSDFRELLTDAILVAHNISFDMTFLNEELERVGEEKIQPYVVDTVELSRILLPKAPSYKLNELAEYLNISHDNPHRAISDALVTADLLILLFNKLQSLPANVIDQLLMIAKPLRTDFAILCDQLTFQNRRQDLEQFKGLSIKKRVDDSTPDTEMDIDYSQFLEKMYGDTGTLSKAFSQYEKRDAQVMISEKIYDHFKMNKHMLIEAETGLGKTISYLIPAIYEALHDRNRVVISTTNTNLQSQLIDQDLQKLDIPVKVAIMKGKSHYLSLQNFEQFYHDPHYRSYQDTLLKAMILVWLTETTTGDLDEIQFPIEKHPIFYQIVVQNERISKEWKDYCFYHRMVHKAKNASIIVTNHSLLAIDMLAEKAILPEYNRLIIDEAHQLEHMATNYLGDSLSYFELTAFYHQLEKNNASYQPFQRQLDTVKFETDTVFRQLYQAVKVESKGQKSVTDIGRLKSVWKNEQREINDSIFRLLMMLQDLAKLLPNNELEEQHQIMEIKDLLRHLLIEENTEAVTWLEIDQQGAENAVFIQQEPFSVKETLQEHLFAKRESIILISATLTMNQSFQYMKERLGLDAAKTNELIVEEYFDYRNNAELLIPNDLPAIQYPNNDQFIYAVNESIISLAEQTGGRMLVLFTSYDMLRKSYYILKETDLLSEYRIIGQGVTTGSRNRLIKQFQAFDKSILLGTNAYWQGIDIPGNDLACLVIVKLPFQSPQDPVYLRKSEYVKQQGKNPFMELALPQAVLQFKQGFGRLMRKDTDRGMIFVFDDRIMTKKYGKTFIQSIPEIPVHYESMQQLLGRVSKWF
ncbi:ATP-dependent DNA helicase DinG [Gracilibacillus sp. S3-1-1]|uniref:ATP-dependent DNA helicase DinG n=1 Tax=Gracilibacillus pellucidus TaxID=3095368 RepID=A0ACC6M5M7_9BACI|nr:ATP-dependent DNA helicase DinG [Gracilibacillus sp. S3-1-1]MDX8046142.1 ATP-dependent DNA helicase DinG [Gracilibacillus sp. S3-1-1]